MEASWLSGTDFKLGIHIFWFDSLPLLNRPRLGQRQAASVNLTCDKPAGEQTFVATTSLKWKNVDLHVTPVLSVVLAGEWDQLAKTNVA